MVRSTDGTSGESATPGESDLRGEELAGHLAEPEGYAIAPDETEAEELAEELVDEGFESGDEVEIDDPSQLADAEEGARVAETSELTSLADQVRSSRPVRKSVDVAKKDAPTPSRKKAKVATADRSATPTEFVNQSIEELKKVVWPTPQQVRQYFAVVLVFVLFIMLYVVALDLGFGALLLKLLG